MNAQPVLLVLLLAALASWLLGCVVGWVTRGLEWRR